MNHQTSLFDYYPEKISEWQLRKTAEKFDISMGAAIKMKLRYAVEAVEIWEEAFEPIAFLWIDQIARLKAMESRLKRPISSSITDSMIEQARESDINRVVEFVRGKATAWCHEDKNPSLTYMSKTNTAWCAACGKYFDPIAVLMERDGMTFQQAVKYLCS